MNNDSNSAKRFQVVDYDDGIHVYMNDYFYIIKSLPKVRSEFCNFECYNFIIPT